MTATDATDSAKKVEKTGSDTTASSHKIVEEVNNELKAAHSNGHDQFAKALSTQLEKDGFLPKLALAGLDNPDGLKLVGDGKKLDIQKLNDVAQGKSGGDDPANRMLAQFILDHATEMHHGNLADGISTTELETWAKSKGVDRIPGQPIPVEAARRLDDPTLDETAKQLHDALHRTGGHLFWEHDDPDKDKVWRMLEPLGQADRQRLEQIYHEKYDNNGKPDTLRHELKDKLGGDNGVDWRKAEADLNRTDGRTNDAGALMVAITTAKKDKDIGNAEIRGVFETLNSSQIAQLDVDFQKQYGMSYQDALKKANLSDATKDALPTLEKGTDKKNARRYCQISQHCAGQGRSTFTGRSAAR